jgi:acyl-CoA thioesterase-2
MALRAAGAEASIKRPVTMHVQYLRVAQFAEVEIAVTKISQGRRSETFGARITQAGKPMLEAIVRTAAKVDGLVHDDAKRVDLPAPETLPTREELIADSKRGAVHAFWSNFDEIRCIDRAFYSERRQAREPRFREWYKLRCAEGFGDPFLDAGRSLLMIDTLTWPSAVQAHVEPKHIAPSLDVTLWFHASSPEDPWLYCEGHAPIAHEGIVGTHGKSYDRAGRLLASGGGQLLCVPAPSGD